MLKTNIKLKELARIIKNTRFSELVKEFDENQMKILYCDEADLNNTEYEYYTIQEEGNNIYNVSYRYEKREGNELKKFTFKSVHFREKDDKCVIREIVIANNFRSLYIDNEGAYYKNKHSKRSWFKLKYKL